MKLYFLFGQIVFCSTDRFQTVQILGTPFAGSAYAQFDLKVSEYFYRNFGAPGTDYLISVANIRKGKQSLPYLISQVCSDQVREAINAEMNRITDGYSTPYLNPVKWQRIRKSIDSPRYSVHRFVGILELISKTESCPFDDADKINFIKDVEDSLDRKNLSDNVRVFKNERKSMPHELVEKALHLIGNPTQAYRRAIFFMISFAQVYDSYKSDLRLIELLKSLLNNVSNAKDTPPQWTVDKAIYRLDLLFGIRKLYDQMKNWRNAVVVQIPDCSKAATLVTILDQVILKILQIVLRDDPSDSFENTLGYNTFLRCEYIPVTGLYAAIQAAQCSQKCESLDRVITRLSGELNKITT